MQPATFATHPSFARTSIQPLRILAVCSTLTLVALGATYSPDAQAQALRQSRGAPFYIFQSPNQTQEEKNKASANNGEAENSQSTEKVDQVSDPLEFVNRPIFYFNDKFDQFLLKPVATGYDYVAPSLVKKGVNNFFQNLKEPGNILNYALQGNKEAFGNSAGRLLTNTIFGIGGIFDVASEASITPRNTSFGQTLSSYRVAPGPYVVVPFLGPSNVRDTTGLILVDIHTKPQNYLHGQDQTITLTTESVATRAQYLKASELVDNAVIGDKYEFIRNASIQRTRSQDERALEDKADIQNSGVSNPSGQDKAQDDDDNAGKY